MKRGVDLLYIENLEKSYKSFKVLKGLNMHVDKGDIYGFIGKNGCGKTTTMNIVASIIQKDGGKITLGGHSGEKIKIGYLPESPALFTYMNAVEYLEYIAASCLYTGDIKRRIDELLSMTDMQSAKQRKIKGYSRGMIQRLGIAAAIFSDPDLLLLDEPTSALDPQGRAEVISIINRLRDLGSTIVLSTHILSDVERISNKIGIIRDGVIVEEGTIREIKAKYAPNQIQINLLDYNEDVKKKVYNTVSAEAFFESMAANDDTKTVIINMPTAYDATHRVAELLVANGLLYSNIKILQPSLEETYFKVVNGNAI